MMQTPATPDYLELFRHIGALRQGHFVLRSGLHSPYYFQCAKVGEDLALVTRLVADLLQQARTTGAGALAGPADCDAVIAPAVGGLVLGQEVARQLGKRFIFAEKSASGDLVLRRNFVVRPQERYLIVEDVVTRGGRVQEVIDIVRAGGGIPVHVLVLVDRSQGKVPWDLPYTALVAMDLPVYSPGALPAELQAMPVEKPGS
jgi:orotate phosphoribosyltransferase